MCESKHEAVKTSEVLRQEKDGGACGAAGYQYRCHGNPVVFDHVFIPRGGTKGGGESAVCLKKIWIALSASGPAGVISFLPFSFFKESLLCEVWRV